METLPLDGVCVTAAATSAQASGRSGSGDANIGGGVDTVRATSAGEVSVGNIASSVQRWSESCEY